MQTRLTLFADYHQIHVLDERSQRDLGDAWTEQALTAGIAITDDAVAISTEDNLDVHVHVDVDVLDTEPHDDSHTFDHVAEATMSVPSGRIVVMGCTDYFPAAARFDVPPGAIHLRASRSTPAASPHDDAEQPTELLRLQLWPPTTENLR